MRLLSLVLASACLMVGDVRPLIAQTSAESTTAAFHPGEWGVGLVQGRYLAEGGVLRFSTPTLAWVLDGVATYDRQVVSDAGPFGTDFTTHSSALSAQFGPRWYHGVNSHLARFGGVGVSGGYASTQFSQSDNSQKTWIVGAYGEIGLQYLFTPHVGLGWRGTLTGYRARSTQVTGTNPSSTEKSTYYHVSLEPVQVIGTIYF